VLTISVLRVLGGAGGVLARRSRVADIFQAEMQVCKRCRHFEESELSLLALAPDGGMEVGGQESQPSISGGGHRPCATTFPSLLRTHRV